jgi:suppressor for copper-sensitivity B
MVGFPARTAYALAACLLMGWFPSPAQPQALPRPAPPEESSVRLVAATSGIGGLASATAGLHFRLDPGWKIYWRSPGDAGLPPSVD